MKSLAFVSIFLSIFVHPTIGLERTIGDLNGDGEVNLLDTVMMVNHIQGTQFITDSEALKWQADVNGDGLVNSFDVEGSLDFVFKREPTKKLPLTTTLATSPYAGEGDIALTREFVVRFNMPLKEGTVITNEMFYAYAGGELQVTSARLSSDRMKATLFLNGFRWPSNSKVTVTLDGSNLSDFLDRTLDLDGDGQAGGVANWSFSTLSVEASDPSTVVRGQVFDSDNSDGEKPLEGVIVSVVGNEDQWTVVTDANGEFRLSSAPVGRFFVVVDGRLVGSQPGETIQDDSWKDRDYYTFVGKAWEAVPGKEVNATKYGSYEEDGTYVSDPRDGKIYLPLVKKGALQTINPGAETEVAFASGYLDEASPEQAAMLQATSITIPPGSLQSDDGVTGGSVGIAPVDPDRLPEPLPESLAMPLVITIQTDGPSNFDVPVPARFPNVDNLPPGAKSALWSFDHDTGVWEISGPMTVSEDGQFLETDPGVGIRQPGWHGSAPGAQIFGQAVLTGPSLDKTVKGACGVSHANMDLTENEFTSLGRLSEGIEETVFGANEAELAFSKDVLSAGERFTSGGRTGGLDWDKFRMHAKEDALLHSTLARKVASLLGDDEFWNAFSATATIMRDNALLGAINASKHNAINQAHLNFLQKLEQSKLSVSRQIEKWDNYSIALNALLGPISAIAGHSVLQTDREELAQEIQSTLKAYRALPGGRQRLDGILKRFASQWQDFLQSTLDGNLHAYQGESFVFLKRFGSEREENRKPPIAAQRIRVGKGGSYDAIVRPNSWYEAWMLEPTTLVIGCTTFISPRNGGNGPVPPIPLCHDDEGDVDYDYLSDRGERVVGTHKNQSDTDGDGIPDGFEILNGTDPSGGNPVFTGVLATIPPTNGAFSDFVTTGNDLAILGNGPQGIDIFEIGSGVQPIKLSSFDTPGSVRKAALSQNYLSIADAGAGLTVLDLTDPENPIQLWNLPQESPANAVAVAGKIAFVGLENGVIRSFDLFSGQQIDEVTLAVPSGSMGVEDLAWANNQLYALTDSPYYRQWGSWRSKFHSIPSQNGRFADDDGPFLPRNEVSNYGYRPYKNGRKLFVGDRFAYVADIQGFNHIDLSVPTSPSEPTRIKTNSIGWRQIVSNGSGLAITAEAATYRNPGDVSIYTTAEDGSLFRAGGFLENFESTFPTSGDTRSVSIYNGLAYAADGSSGLQVVNYRSYDILGNSPSLEVQLDDMEGVVEEAKLLTLRAFVFDDVQVKNVDFFVDGEKVFVDGGYPFSHTLEVPLRKDQATLRLRVVARDTGGNEAYWPGPLASEEKILSIADDLKAPEIVTYFPRENSTVYPGETVVAVFNERMDPESIHVRSIRLYEVHDDNSSSIVELDSVSYDDSTQSAYATLPSSLMPAKYRLLANDKATDLAGNALKDPAPDRHLYGPGELRGQFWYDRNHNTLKDSDEEALRDWTVYLDSNNNGERDPGEPNATTDQAGNYAFTGLLPGGYTVAEEILYGWVQTYPREKSLGNQEVFTNAGWIYEGDNISEPLLTLDTLGNAWFSGIVPEGNFSIGNSHFDGNETAGFLYLARVAPTGLVDRVETFGKPDYNSTGISINLTLQSDLDGGIWLSGHHDGILEINEATVDANGTQSSFLARFNQDFEATYFNSFSKISISALSPDPEGRLGIAGSFSGEVTLDEFILESNGSTDAFLARLASTGSISWAKSLGGDGNETVETISIDDQRRFWIGGDSDSANFSSGSNSLDLSGDAGGYLALFNHEGNDLWAIDPIGNLDVIDDSSGAWFLDANGSNPVVRFADDNGSVQASFHIQGATVTEMLSSSDGNLFVCLYTDYGWINLNDESIFSSSDYKSILVKLKSNGSHAWTLPIDLGNSSLHSLARGSDDFVWVLGSISGALGEEFTVGEYSTTLGSNTGLLLKVDPSGEVAGLWTTSAPASQVKIDSNDNIWVTGNHLGDGGDSHSISLGDISLTGESTASSFVGRIGKAGADFHNVQLLPGSIIDGLDFGNSLPLIETRTAMCVGGPDEDASRSIVTDPAGNGYYAGDFTGYFEFGGKRLESDGQNDAMFVKFLPGGEIAWAQNFGGDGDDLGHAIFADENGSLFATGTFQGTAQFGDFELVSAGMRDIFVLRLDDNGSPLWAFRAGGPQDDDALALVADSNDSVYVAGSIQETADFGPYHLLSQGDKDAYLLKLDYNGSVQWIGSLMSQDRVEIRALTLDQKKLPVVAGDFAGTLQLRGTEDSDDGIEYLTLIGSSDTNASDSNASSLGTISLSLVDLDGDGMLDVLTENHSSEFFLDQNQGSGFASTIQIYPDTGDSNNSNSNQSGGNTSVTESWTFTNAGNEGHLGPTLEQVNSAYSGTNLEGKVTMHVMDGNVTGIQEWVVPKNGVYMIEAWGAQGGAGGSGTNGGLGAYISGLMDLNKGDKIKVLVGQSGESKNNGGGGGGGSFVVDNNNNPIAIASGGGGGNGHLGEARGGFNGGSGLISENGGDSNIISSNYGTPSPGGSSFGFGGTNGNGGGGGVAAGGGGFFTDGGLGGVEGQLNIKESEGKAYVNGGNGGHALNDLQIPYGGFGGGGSGRTSSGYGGGGGGYSGGGAGSFDNDSHGLGGGGGSFNAGSEQNNIAGINEGHGKVIISLLGNPKLESGGQTDIFMVRFDANGTVMDSIQGSGSGIESVNGLAMGKSNEFYLTGVYGPEFTLGEKSVSGVSPIINAYLAQVDGNFSTQWIKTIGGGGFNRGESVAVSAKGRAFFVGSYTGTAHFDERSLTSAGGADAYLAEFDQRGNVLRLFSHGGTLGDAGTAVALDNDGGIIMTGTYHGEASIFDGEHICHEHGGTDVFVARYDYGLQEPETHYVVTVEEDDNGTEVILINDEPAPEIELIPGLEYTFEIDENVSEEHPFVIVEEGDGGSDLWKVEEDVNKTEDKVVIKVDEETPVDLGYGSETKEGLGGVIKVKQDPKPSYRLTLAEFDDGSNNVDGADIKVFKNGQEVSLEEPFEEGTRLRVELTPSDDYVFEGWEGDLPEDANRSLSKDQTFVLTMDRDRTLKAYFSTPAPDDPRDFLDDYDIKVAAQQADEFGQPIEGGDGPSYTLRFSAFPGGMNEDGYWGYMRVIPEGDFPDFDGDGTADQVISFFTFEQIDETSGSFQAINPMATFSSDNTTQEVWGGGMELSFTYQKPNGDKEAGAYVILKNDGTSEQGGWDADNLRKDFSLNP